MVFICLGMVTYVLNATNQSNIDLRVQVICFINGHDFIIPTSHYQPLLYSAGIQKSHLVGKLMPVVMTNAATECKCNQW